jgi:hypothetical protein
LLDSEASGRVPSFGPLSPDVVATETLALALQPSQDLVLPKQCHINKYADPTCWPQISARTVRRLQTAQPMSCRALDGPRTVVVSRGHAIKIEQGVVDVVYKPVGGGSSAPRQLSAGTVVALAGPLPLLVSPSPAAPDARAVVCL